MDDTAYSENRIDLYRQSMTIVEEVLIKVKEMVYNWPNMNDMNLEPEKSRTIKILKDTLSYLRPSTSEVGEQDAEAEQDMNNEGREENSEVSKLCCSRLTKYSPSN